MRFALLIMGPAGSGKSTFSSRLIHLLQHKKRDGMIVNLDPATEDLCYSPVVDIRQLISLDDVSVDVEERFGPNGGLVFCMEYLAEHLEWLRDELWEANEGDDAYFVLDCPGQIELYSHGFAMRRIVMGLKRWGYSLGGVFLVDGSLVAGEVSKYLAGIMIATAGMVQLEIPWVNVLSKMDLVSPGYVAHVGGFAREDDDSAEKDDDEFEKNDSSWRLCETDFEWVRSQLAESIRPKPGRVLTKLDQRWERLNAAICQVVEDFAMVRFLPLDVFNPESIEVILDHMDNMTQYGEDVEPMEPRDDDDVEEELQ